MTLATRFSGGLLFCLLCCALPPAAHSYVPPRSPLAFAKAPTPTAGNKSRSRRKSPLSVGAGADYFGEREDPPAPAADPSIEAALGNPQHLHASEYERDAEFYRKRNEAYSKSLLKAAKANEANSGPAPSSYGMPGELQGASPASKGQENPLKASFDHVEASTNSLLTGRPLVALAIFGATGMLVAYLSGFFFLEGYIENWNPAENDQIPYWDDAEIHTIQRAVQ